MGKNRWIAAIVAMTLAGSAVSTWAQRTPETLKTQDYTLKVEVVAEGLKDPWSIAFIDANRALITEKEGRLRMWENGQLQSEAVKGIPVVDSGGQGGLLDVAIDPDYAKSGWVYLGYSHVQGDKSRGAAMTRIIRGKIKDNTWTEQQVLFEAKPAHYRNGGVHYGCRIVFDKEGLLYFSIGERGNQDDAQDIARPNGKVHRINRDGTIPKDNPFVGKPNSYESIYSFGNRNQQGLAFDLQGALWATEHGPKGGDELNWIRPGINYGWPVITYGENYNNTPVGQGLREKEGLEQPVKYWKPSPALCGLDFVRGDLFPKWKGRALLGALAHSEVKLVEIKDNKYVGEEVILKGMGRVRDVVNGPDGAIYVVFNGPHRILRLSPK